VTARAEDLPPGPATKREWRRLLRAARAAVAPEIRAQRAEALAAGMLRIAAEHEGPLCAYLPVGSEPGSSAAVDALRDAGFEVLLPIVPAQPGPLDWARHDGRLAPGPIGLREPAGPRLGPTAIGRARLVFVPALAVDRRGVRLGQAGGYYDRSLPLATPGTPLVAVVDEGELVDELPVEPHDHRVTAVLQPSGRTAVG
jgi:5-formyltetrahydrofolate cyclo-ligase